MRERGSGGAARRQRHVWERTDPRIVGTNGWRLEKCDGKKSSLHSYAIAPTIRERKPLLIEIELVADRCFRAAEEASPPRSLERRGGASYLKATMLIDTTAVAAPPMSLSIDEALQANPIELGATVATLIAHPGIAPYPKLVALMLSAGPDIGSTLGMTRLPPEFRSAIETRMMLGAAAAQFAIENSFKPVTLVPAYAMYPGAWIDEGYLALERIWVQRLAAGEVFRQLAEARRLSEAYVPPPGVRRPSVEQLVDSVLDEVGISETKNFTARIWRPSWPVAYLAAAIRSFDREARGMWKHGVLPPNLIFSPRLLWAVLRRAEDFATLIERAPLRGHLRVADLIRLKLIASSRT